MCVFVKAIDSLSSPPRKPIAEKYYLPVQIMGLEAYLMPDYIIMKTQNRSNTPLIDIIEQLIEF